MLTLFMKNNYQDNIAKQYLIASWNYISNNKSIQKWNHLKLVDSFLISSMSSSWNSSLLTLFPVSLLTHSHNSVKNDKKS